ncbi:hypothetical protein BH23BAC1_BH23BAC1_25190 [soil metagenome]
MENVIHIEQRDREETTNYGSMDIQKTAIKCFSLTDIERKGIDTTILDVLQHVKR